MASPEARERFARKNEEDDLRRAFEFLDRKKDGLIDEDDLNQVFMSLGHKTKKGEIADMIWEVDEDCDNALNWKARFVLTCSDLCKGRNYANLTEQCTATYQLANTLASSIRQASITPAETKNA
jgi:hypothetical protein